MRDVTSSRRLFTVLTIERDPCATDLLVLSIDRGRKCFGTVTPDGAVAPDSAVAPHGTEACIAAVSPNRRIAPTCGIPPNCRCIGEECNSLAAGIKRYPWRQRGTASWHKVCVIESRLDVQIPSANREGVVVVGISSARG